MSKLLTIVVPVYNTEKYLEKCLDSLIIEEYLDRLEVLVVIDGSPDNSIEIAQKFEKKYPNTFITVEKENGGHGSAINRGLELATGTYFRVLDSDDWFDKNNFRPYLDKLSLATEDIVLSHIIREYISINKSVLWCSEQIEYDKCYTDMSILNNLPPEFFAMARCSYRTSLLRNNKLHLNEKRSFEEAFLHVFPLIFLKSFVFYNLPIYHYFLERSGQSVKQKVTLKQSNDWKALVMQIIDFYIQHNAELSNIKREFLLRVLSMYADNEYRTMYALSYCEARNELKDYHAYLKSLPFYKQIQGKHGLFYATMPYWMSRCIRELYNKLIFILRR